MTHRPSPLNPYEALLLGYAIGALDEAQSLIIGAHLSLSHKAQQFLKYYEAIGGYLMEAECEPVAMSESALDCVLAKLDTPPEWGEKECISCAFPDDVALPPLLANMLALQKNQSWHHDVPGMEILPLALTCRHSTARLMRAGPGFKAPAQPHPGTEITLILNGTFLDEGAQYHRGDLYVKDGGSAHAPEACKEQGCVCLVVSSAPVGLTNLAAMLHPFMKL